MSIDLQKPEISAGPIVLKTSPLRNWCWTYTNICMQYSVQGSRHNFCGYLTFLDVCKVFI